MIDGLSVTPLLLPRFSGTENLCRLSLFVYTGTYCAWQYHFVNMSIGFLLAALSEEYVFDELLAIRMSMTSHTFFAPMIESTCDLRQVMAAPRGRACRCGELRRIRGEAPHVARVRVYPPPCSFYLYATPR